MKVYGKIYKKNFFDFMLYTGIQVYRYTGLRCKEK